MKNDNHPTLSTQGSASIQENHSGGTTNLSMEQLKTVGGMADPSKDNPDGLTDEDDLNEIRAADDLDEPNIEEYQPDDKEEDKVTDKKKNDRKN